jgi:hypothetical protein
MKRSIYGISATAILASATQAAIIVDNFDSYTYLTDMNGQGGWTVTNGVPADSVPGPSLDGPVVIADSYTWDTPIPSVGSATVGGVEQTTLGLTSLSHTASVPLVDNIGGYQTLFQIETAYTESIGLDPRNPFQIVLTADSGNLLTIDLSPGGAGEYDVSWDSDFVAGGFMTMGTVSAGTPTQFQLETWWNGTAVAYEFTNAGSPVSSGVFTGAAGQFDTITGLSINWDSTGGAGGNSITIDNVALVPEPSSALLGLLGASFAFLRRRRA